jgi:TonB family protein
MLDVSMKVRKCVLGSFLVFVTFPLFASDTYEQELSSALVKHVVVLRNFYTDEHLKFGNDGKLASKAKNGFGPTDGRVYVRQIQLKPDKLIFTGTRPMDVFDQESEKWELGDTGKSISIEIQLPTTEPASAAVPRLLNSVFLKQSELARLNCSPEEELDFLEYQRTRMKRATKDAPKLPDVASLDELRPYCLPGGERAYGGRRGITAPHARHAPDPSYDEAARQAKLQGTTVLLAIITPQGATSAISVWRSLGSGLDEKLRPLGHALDQRAVEAVSQWKFDPATFQGQPVPVIVDVSVNFHLN